MRYVMSKLIRRVEKIVTGIYINTSGQKCMQAILYGLHIVMN